MNYTLSSSYFLPNSYFSTFWGDRKYQFSLGQRLENLYWVVFRQAVRSTQNDTGHSGMLPCHNVVIILIVKKKLHAYATSFRVMPVFWNCWKISGSKLYRLSALLSMIININLPVLLYKLAEARICLLLRMSAFAQDRSTFKKQQSETWNLSYDCLELNWNFLKPFQ